MVKFPNGLFVKGVHQRDALLAQSSKETRAQGLVNNNVDVDHPQTDRTTLSALKKIVLFLEAPTFKIVVESMHEIGCDRRTPPFGSCPEKEIGLPLLT